MPQTPHTRLDSLALHTEDGLLFAVGPGTDGTLQPTAAVTAWRLLPGSGLPVLCGKSAGVVHAAKVRGCGGVEENLSLGKHVC